MLEPPLDVRIAEEIMSETPAEEIARAMLLNALRNLT